MSLCLAPYHLDIVTRWQRVCAGLLSLTSVSPRATLLCPGVQGGAAVPAKPFICSPAKVGRVAAPCELFSISSPLVATVRERNCITGDICHVSVRHYVSYRMWRDNVDQDNWWQSWVCLGVSLCSRLYSGDSRQCSATALPGWLTRDCCLSLYL